MSEGGTLPWKTQTVTRRGPTCDYSTLRSPLPKPPPDHTWVQDPSTREWFVVPIHDAGAVAVAHVSSSEDQGLGVGKVMEGTMKEGDVVVRLMVPEEDDGVVRHCVKSTDTLQGICLRYKVTPTVLRRLNHFSGTNLALAPPTLVLPPDTTAPSSLTTDIDHHNDMKNRNVHRFLHAMKLFALRGGGGGGGGGGGEMGRKEAECYLEMNDGDLDRAVRDAQEDIGWEGGS